MDVIAPNITPSTFNLKFENPPFVGFVGTCIVLGWKHTKPLKNCKTTSIIFLQLILW
jgi:hypothetical protein